MRCDWLNCEQEAEPAILSLYGDDGELIEERSLLACPEHTAELVQAVEA